MLLGLSETGEPIDQVTNMMKVLNLPKKDITTHCFTFAAYFKSMLINKNAPTDVQLALFTNP